MSQTSINGLRIVLRLQLLLIHSNKLLAAARIFAETIVRNAVKPCGKSGFTTKAANVLVRAKKSFLCEIVSRGNVCASELSKEATHSGLMPPHELTKSVLIIIRKNSRDKVRIS
jgi:hypothetical protein